MDLVVRKNSSAWQIRRGAEVTAEYIAHDSAIDAACDMARREGGAVYVFGDSGAFQQAYAFPVEGAPS